MNYFYQFLIDKNKTYLYKYIVQDTRAFAEFTFMD